jgi:DNA-directed RNA polymerase subunit RPC12/RpoP
MDSDRPTFPYSDLVYQRLDGARDIEEFYFSLLELKGNGLLAEVCWGEDQTLHLTPECQARVRYVSFRKPDKEPNSDSLCREAEEVTTEQKQTLFEESERKEQIRGPFKSSYMKCSKCGAKVEIYFRVLALLVDVKCTGCGFQSSADYEVVKVFVDDLIGRFKENILSSASQYYGQLNKVAGVKKEE